LARVPTPRHIDLDQSDTRNDRAELAHHRLRREYLGMGRKQSPQRVQAAAIAFSSRYPVLALISLMPTLGFSTDLSRNYFNSVVRRKPREPGGCIR
jgi:hypothetical protein